VILLSAFLHDIGKFLQRVQKYKIVHSKWSASFVDDFLPENIVDNRLKTAIKDVVLSHHETSLLKDEKNMTTLDIVKKSDHLSSKEREKREDKGKPERERLQSLFSDISLNNIHSGDKYFYEISSLPISYPKKEAMNLNAEKHYKNIQKELERDLRNLNKLNLDFRDYTNTLNYILFKHLRFVPSAVYVNVPDVSLYDHLKTTAAIALCLYRSNEKKKFLLINGDISGIQNFIFESFKAEESDKGAARRLRGRSFFIKLLVDAATSYICNKLNLYEINILWQAGGNFLILSPNSEEIRKNILKIEKDINRYLAKYIGNVQLIICYEEGEEKDLENFSDYLERLKEKTDNKKNQKYYDPVDRKVEKILKEEEICVACGRKKKTNGEVCEICKKLEDLGRKLSKLENRGYLIRNCESQRDWIFNFGDFEISYLLSEVPEDGETIFSLNNFDFLEKKNCSQGFKIIGHFAPIKDGDIICFSTLTDKKEEINERKHPEEGGTPTKLSIMKADVDDLGLLFSLGFDRDKRSISRISLLSFLFEYFFSWEINKLAKEKNVYVVFSGGDDLTVAGRFDEVISFAEKVQKKFEEWTCHNPDIHISSGIEFAGHKFPVKRLIKYTEKQLKKAKSPKDKNKITLFEETLNWREFEEQLSLGKLILIHTKNNNIGRGFAFSLLKIRELSYFRDRIERGDRILINPEPYVRYLIARNWRDKSEKGKKGREEFIKRIINNFEHIKVGISYFSLLNRYGGE